MPDRAVWLAEVADKTARTGLMPWIPDDSGCTGLTVKAWPEDDDSPSWRPTELRFTARFPDQVIVCSRPYTLPDYPSQIPRRPRWSWT